MDSTSTSSLERDKTLLRFLTCGSVDDGKSTLIGRLLHDTGRIYDDQFAAVKRDSAKFGTTGAGEIDLALLTDGLKAEREQGITIDVAYRYFNTPKRKFIIADTPGHEQYTRNMATGASTCQLAVILIDARKGVVTQTRRHSFIVALMGIKHVIVAINKMDLVGHDQAVFQKIQADYTGFVAKLDIPDVQFIPMSALKGDNVVTKSPAMPWFDGAPLLSHLETVHIASDRNLADMRFPVQYVLRPSSDFRGYSGTIASGILKRGDEITVVPSGKHSRVKSIVTYDGSLDEAFAPMSVTVTLEDEIDVSRGDMIVHPHRPPRVSSEVEAMMVWMNEKPLALGRPYWIKHSTRVVTGEVAEIRYRLDVNSLEQTPARQLAMNEVGHAQLSLNQPLAYDAYRSNGATGAFIVIDRITNNTVGAGMILDRGDGSGGDKWGRAPSSNRLDVRTGNVDIAQREQRLGQKGVSILLTGLTGSGKVSIAHALEKRLFEAGRSVVVLSGQNMRQGLCRDLGFSADERSENLRRSAEVAKILNDAGLIAICAFLAPHDAVREKARAVIGKNRFLEVYLSAPLEVCRQRDQSGAYDNPSISTSYEVPTAPDLVLPTHEISIDQSVDRIIAELTRRGFLATRDRQ